MSLTSLEEVVARASAWLHSEVVVFGAFLNKALSRWLAVAGIGTLAFILGYIGLNGYLSHQRVPEFGKDWADILFYDLQLFVMNAAPASGSGPYPLSLEIARFLAPAAAAGAAVETVHLLLREQLRRWSAASATNHAIVTGDGPIAAEIALRLLSEYRKVVLIRGTPVETAEARDPRLLEVSGDPADAVTLRAAGLARAEVLYACAELSATNAATALRAREVSQAQNRPLMAYAQVRDAEICMALRARRIGAADDPRFRLDFFSIEDTAARVLLDEHPLALEGRWPAQVVIVGFGRLGRAVLREIARRPRPDGTPVTVKIRGEAPDSGSDFLDRFPAVRRACSVVWDGIALTGPFGEGPTLVFVCLADNDDALSVGLTAAHSFSTRSGRVVICMGEASPFGAVLTGKAALLDDERGRLAVFGLIEEGCVPRRIREDLHDQLARAIHQAYLDNCRARGDSPSVNKSMRPWEELPDDIKQANLAQAAHLSTKLDAIDCTVIPESAALPGFAFTSAEIELLAHMEHDRWMAERHAQGYTYGPDRVGKQHPDLVDWQYLSESAGEKDRDAVRELPAILRQAGFQILRLPPRTPWAPR